MIRAAAGLLFLFICLSIRCFSQNISNEGTDFWTVFPTHVPSGSALANIAVFVTSKFDTEVTVSCGVWQKTMPVPANSAVQFDVPRTSAYIADYESNSAAALPNRGIHVKVTEGKPKVSVYTHIYAGKRSAASLILPYETLGQSYYSMNYVQSPLGGKNFITLVAADDNTDLQIHERNGNIKKIKFDHAGDVYEYMSGTSDLTGVYITTDPETSSCKRFAAFSGSSMMAIGCYTSYDPLYQQLYPVASWGKNYGVVPFKDRLYLLVVLAQEDDTVVQYNGNTVTLNRGSFFEIDNLKDGMFLSANKLISVAQYSMSQNCSSATSAAVLGDPEMVILNPIEFNIKDITVFSSKLQDISERYINVLMKTNQTASFKIDGVAPTSPWIVLSPGSPYSYNQLELPNITGDRSYNSLTLKADGGFNAIAYGFGDFESYAYSAGTNLSSNNYLTVYNTESNTASSNGCVGETVQLKINLPYQIDEITWKLDDETPVTQRGNAIPFETSVVNGQTLYTYTYPIQKTYTTVGSYALDVDMHVPNNETACFSEAGSFNRNYVFNIYNLPQAAFELPEVEGCANHTFDFKDISISNTADFSVSEWLWDFGDGTYSKEQHPKHAYTTEGVYMVKLTVKSETGCSSTVSDAKQITVYPVPESKFDAGTKTCVNTDLLFTDASTIHKAEEGNKIIRWHWDFGDGNTIDKTTNDPFKYQYTQTGIYKVSLTTFSERECAGNTVTEEIEVMDLPIADFSLPDVCSDDLVTTFINQSVSGAALTNGLYYSWDFGDAANPGSNRSAEKDGKHRYTVPGEYQVSLTVSNEYGCKSIVKTKRFVVNSRVETAGFTVQNEGNLCSNADVIINNTSTVQIGRIVKIEVYKDFDREPHVFETIYYPGNEDIHLRYEPFGGTETREVKIKLIAYSGTVCSKEYEKIIKLKPVPILVFPTLKDVCQNDGIISVNLANESSGIKGTGRYLGDGVDATGNFNPKQVEPGVHQISYIFTAENNCEAVAVQSIKVYKNPVADAGSTLYILAGGELNIPAKAEGNGLIYKWVPAGGLSSDHILNPVAAPEKDTEYTLTVTSAEGCTAVSKVKVVILEQLVPPNSFTPNGDNVNDVWSIKYLDSYPKATVEVFNRNGNRVFYSTGGYKVPFDGTYKSEPLPVGVYYYIINPGNGRKTLSGTLTIIR